MQKKLGKDSEDFNFFAEYWKLYQDFYIPEERETYWQELLDAEDKLLRKYNGNKFLCDIIMAYNTEIERRYREEKDNDIL